MEHRPAFKIFLVVFLILVVLCIAASLFTLFAVPENSGSDVSDIIPPIPDTGDSEHFISMVSSDGYVRITIYNEPVPADSENPWGYYYMHVWIDWLKTPISRMTDSLSIECPSFSLANSEEQYSVMTYTTTGLSGKRAAHQTEQGHNFYDWNLPNSTPLQRVSDIRIYARVKLYVTSPTIHQILQTYISYTHKKSLGGSNNSTYSLRSANYTVFPAISYDRIYSRYRRGGVNITPPLLYAGNRQNLWLPSMKALRSKPNTYKGRSRPRQQPSEG